MAEITPNILFLQPTGIDLLAKNYLEFLELSYLVEVVLCPWALRDLALIDGSLGNAF